MKILFATQNPNKVKEIQGMMPKNILLIGLAELNVVEDIPETAKTLEGNAALKAKYIWKKFQIPCFADDTGLEVETLHGEPGVRSARYAGEQKDQKKNMALLLHKLKGKTNRKAQFRTSICYIHQNQTIFFEGKVEGLILHEKRGTQGFGYDPIFMPNGSKKSFAEMRLEEKNTISHRALAFKKLIAHLQVSLS